MLEARWTWHRVIVYNARDCAQSRRTDPRVPPRAKSNEAVFALRAN
jgi:hypothetical protein